jgi:prepilin-type N-terminal cleavage/methylation domain-containing protein
MKLKTKMRRGFTLVELLVVIAIIAVLAGLATPAILRSKKKADMVKTVNNAKQIGIAMTEFDSSYDSYPSDDTRETLESEGAEVPDGDHANAYFAQLIVGQAVESEKIFYAKGVRGVKEPDDVFNSRDQVLKQGECGFGYVMLVGNEALSASYTKPSTPLAVAPLKEGGIDPTFDDNAYDGEYVYLRGDSSVATGKLDKAGEGKALLKGQGRKTLFTVGDDTIWEDDEPEVKMPDTRSNN